MSKAKIKAELVKFLSNEGPSVFLMNALSKYPRESKEFAAIQAHYDKRKQAYPNVRDTEVEVVLTVGGVQVPFWKTMEDTFAQFSKSVDKAAGRIAYEATREAGVEEVMSKMMRIVSSAETQLRIKLEKAGLNLPED